MRVSISSRPRRLRLYASRAEWARISADARVRIPARSSAFSGVAVAAALSLHAALGGALIHGWGSPSAPRAAWVTPIEILLHEPDPLLELDPVFEPPPETVPFPDAPRRPWPPPAPTDVAILIAALSEPPAEPPPDAPPPPPSAEAEFAAPMPQTAPLGDDAATQYWARVRARIAQRLRYPPRARAAGIGGTIRVNLELDCEGVPIHIGLPPDAPLLLARAVERAVRDAAPFEPPGPDLPRSAQISVRFDIRANP